MCLRWLPITHICQVSSRVFVDLPASELSFVPQGCWERLYVLRHEYFHSGNLSHLFTHSKNAWVFYPQKLSLCGKNAWVFYPKKLIIYSKNARIISEENFSPLFKMIFSLKLNNCIKGKVIAILFSLHPQILDYHGD